MAKSTRRGRHASGGGERQDKAFITSGGVFQTSTLSGCFCVEFSYAACSVVVLHRNGELAVSLRSFYGVLRLQEHSGGEAQFEPPTAPPAVTHTSNNHALTLNLPPYDLL